MVKRAQTPNLRTLAQALAVMITALAPLFPLVNLVTPEPRECRLTISARADTGVPLSYRRSWVAPKNA